MELIEKHFDEVCQAVKSRGVDIDPTQLKSLVLSLLAYQHFKICIGLQEHVNVQELDADLKVIIALLPTAAEIDDTSRALESLASFVASHEKYFLRNQKDTNGEEMTFTFANETYGKIFDNGEVAFFPTVLKKILEDELKFASADKLITEWRDLNTVLKLDKGQTTRKIRIGKKTYRVYHFKTGILSTDVDSSEVNYYESLGVV